MCGFGVDDLVGAVVAVLRPNAEFCMPVELMWLTPDADGPRPITYAVSVKQPPTTIAMIVELVNFMTFLFLF